MRRRLVDVVAPNSAKPFGPPSSAEGRRLRTLTSDDFWDSKESYSHEVFIIWGSLGAVSTTVYCTVHHRRQNE